MNYVVETSLVAVVSCFPLAVWTFWLVHRDRSGRVTRRALVIVSAFAATLTALAGLGWATFVGSFSYGLGCTSKGGYNCEGKYLVAVDAVCIIIAFRLLYRGSRASKAMRRRA